MLRRLIGLLLVAAELWRRWRRTEEQRQHTEAVDEIRKNPSGWFIGHFGGVREPPEVSRDAADADKAGSGESKTDD